MSHRVNDEAMESRSNSSAEMDSLGDDVSPDQASLRSEQ